MSRTYPDKRRGREDKLESPVKQYSSRLGVDVERTPVVVESEGEAVQGVLVRSVYRGTPAALQSLRRNDVIASIDDLDVFEPGLLEMYLKYHPDPLDVTLCIVRSGREHRVRIELPRYCALTDNLGGNRANADGTVVNAGMPCMSGPVRPRFPAWLRSLYRGHKAKSDLSPNR